MTKKKAVCMYVFEIEIYFYAVTRNKKNTFKLGSSLSCDIMFLSLVLSLIFLPISLMKSSPRGPQETKVSTAIGTNE